MSTYFDTERRKPTDTPWATERGISPCREGTRCHRVGDAIKRLVPGLDVVATSPLVRARRTAQIVAKRMGLAKPAVWDELKPESHLGLLYGRLADIDFDSKVMLVGHEPHLTQFVGSVITGGGDGRCGLTLRKPGLARLAVRTAAPDRVEGDLLWLIPPRVLRLL